jgi:hypothetical protein
MKTSLSSAAYSQLSLASSYDWAMELDLYEKSLIYNQALADSKILRRLQCSNDFNSVKAEFDEGLQLEKEGDFEFDFA